MSMGDRRYHAADRALQFSDTWRAVCAEAAGVCAMRFYTVLHGSHLCVRS